jgi:tetratricopeptide (TPR) repeat protein
MGDTIHELSYDMKFLDLALKSGSREDIGIAYNNLGKYYRIQKQFQKALEYYEKALENQEESEHSHTYGNMAEAYNHLNDPKKAEEMYLQAIEIDKQIGEYKLLGLHKGNLGVFYFGYHRYDEALTTLQESQTISHNSADIATESFALSYLASIDYQNGQINQAKTKATEALRLAKQSGESVVIKKANQAWNLVNGKQ